MRRSASLICVTLIAAGGSSPACTRADRTATEHRPAVVASTDVWGSVAHAVTGDDAPVTAVINGRVDPHSYEPSPTAVASIEDATLTVYNGGGYDTWMVDVLKGHPDIARVDAFAILEQSMPDGSDRPNEHVFYDLPTVKAVAGSVAEILAQRDGTHADDYRRRATDFGRDVDEIIERQRALRTAFAGTGVVATEPVAHYLLVAAGLADRTPEGFTNAIEQDSDPSPADMAAVLDLIAGRQVAVVVVNDQTITGATRQISDAARSAGVPVVSVTETLPAGTDYLSWQSGTVDRLAAALRESR